MMMTVITDLLLFFFVHFFFFRGGSCPDPHYFSGSLSFFFPLYHLFHRRFDFLVWPVFPFFFFINPPPFYSEIGSLLQKALHNIVIHHKPNGKNRFLRQRIPKSPLVFPDSVPGPRNGTILRCLRQDIQEINQNRFEIESFSYLKKSWEDWRTVDST